ncbi:MAG TPA: hypothetical protein VI935_05775 [Thermodesulfobacteriota bacterium]|nr:hypothetical protein [Thermodesulfobacteriota bacterium]
MINKNVLATIELTNNGWEIKNANVEKLVLVELLKVLTKELEEESKRVA